MTRGVWNIGSILIIFPASMGWSANHFSRFTLKGPGYLVSTERGSPITLLAGAADAPVLGVDAPDFSAAAKDPGTPIPRARTPAPVNSMKSLLLSFMFISPFHVVYYLVYHFGKIRQEFFALFLFSTGGRR